MQNLGQPLQPNVLRRETVIITYHASLSRQTGVQARPRISNKTFMQGELQNFDQPLQSTTCLGCGKLQDNKKLGSRYIILKLVFSGRRVANVSFLFFGRFSKPENPRNFHTSVQPCIKW
eukprot:TRINITY_DN643_c0_g2_i1.p1 TRINITY_DN643_c0_g2~~TRINITY_DN643_c0_g2_i1.p1  ORF type:complete len:119 (-),score=2.32 TRINITY_DN643_c0_g2_i1:172-528(-)